MQEYFAIRRRYSPRRVCETQFSKNTQAYFGNCRMLRTGFVFDEPLRTPTYSTKLHTQKYFAIRRRYSPWASMRNTNFKKYAGLSKWSQRGGLENRLPNRHGGSNPSACAKKHQLFGWCFSIFCIKFVCGHNG